MSFSFIILFSIWKLFFFRNKNDYVQQFYKYANIHARSLHNKQI